MRVKINQHFVTSLINLISINHVTRKLGVSLYEEHFIEREQSG